MNKAGTTPLAGADVSFVGLGRAATSDNDGNARLAGLSGGLQVVRIRRVGFTELNDTVTLVANRQVTRRYTLSALVPTLETVHTQAAETKYHSPALRGFEERRLSGGSGHFVSDSTFRANENSTLGNVVVSRMPGLMMQSINGKKIAVSTRKACRGAVLLNACGNKADCYVAIYVDGQLFFNAKMADFSPPSAWPDLDTSFPMSQITGAEYYATSAMAPPGLHVDDDGCGSLWLWTREK